VSDRLLTEKELAHEKLPPGERERWIDQVRETVLRNPALARRLF